MAGPAVIAVLLAGCAGAAVPTTASTPLDRLHRGHGRRTAPASSGPGTPWWVLASMAGVIAVAVTGRWPVALAAVVAALSAARAAAGRRSARRAGARREQAVEILSALVGELRGGAPPRAALAAAAATVLPDVAAAARSPATDLADTLQTVGRAAGHELLTDLALAWRLAESTGAPLARPVATLTAAARADEAVRRELAAQLAGPRATALLLSVLPVAGVLLGAALGADPLGFLLGTGAGNLCLLAGTALVAAGLRWTEAIVAAADRP